MKLLLFVILFSFVVHAEEDVERRRTGLLNLLNEEQTEVTRLSKQVEHQNPNLLLRIAEINLEKARLIKEKENDEYLAIPTLERAKKNKEDYFKTSKQLFLNAQKICLSITSRFPNYKSLGDVYYILAYNFKEFNQEAKAQKYFELAMESTGSKSITKVKTQLALAEIHYNQKNYSQAIPLYEGAINQKDKWWTKDAYNLSWSYFKTGKSDKAIAMMLEIHKKSTTGEYVDMSNLAARDVGLFYAEAGRSDEAIQFYKIIGKNFSEQLIKLAKFLLEQTKPTQAEKTLAEALKYETSETARKDIFLTQLALFDKFGKYDLHLTASEDLKKLADKGILNSDEIEIVKVQAQKMGAMLQKQAVASTYKHKPEIRKKKAEQSSAYFALVGSFDKGKSSESEATYLQAETMYGSENFEDALKLYEKAFDVATNNKDNKYQKLSVEGMLACLAQADVSNKTKDKFYEPVYLRYLKANPKGSKSQEIYEKLFVLYKGKNDIAGAEKILTQYRANFPEKVLEQEKMLEEVIVYHSGKNDTTQIRGWINRINSGEFVVTKKFADRLRQQLTAIQLTDAQTFDSKGDKKAAIENYYKVYQAPESTIETKRNSSYNLALLFFKNNNDKQFYTWAVNSLNIMTVEDVKKFDDTFSIMASELFYRQEFAASTDLALRALNKLCTVNSRTKLVHFRIYTQVNIADGNMEEANKVIEEAKKCGLEDKDISEAYFLMLDECLKKERYELASNTIAKMESDKTIRGRLIPYLQELKIAYRKVGNTEKPQEYDQKINQYFTEATKNKYEIPLLARDFMVNSVLLQMEVIVKEIINLKLSFPEGTFNQTMKKKFSYFTQLNSLAEKAFASGSGKGIVKAAIYKAEAQQRFVKEVRDFVPNGKDENYINAFKKDMVKTTEPILKDSLSLIVETKNTIREKKILSHDNDWFMSSKRLPIKLEYRYIYDGVTMDRGGRK
ncbi:MAG: hypothetical protein ACOYL6_09595 [Bacteriovoracaceae bacterium]